MLVTAFGVVVLLTWALVIMNIRSVVLQYEKDKNRIRLYCFLSTLLVLGSMIIGITSSVVQRVIDSESYLIAENSMPAAYYRHTHR